MSLIPVEGSILGKQVLDKANNVEGTAISFFYGEATPEDKYQDPAFFETQEVIKDCENKTVRPDYIVVETKLGTHLAPIEDLEVLM